MLFSSKNLLTLGTWVTSCSLRNCQCLGFIAEKGISNRNESGPRLISQVIKLDAARYWTFPLILKEVFCMSIRHALYSVKTIHTSAVTFCCFPSCLSWYQLSAFTMRQPVESLEGDRQTLKSMLKKMTPALFSACFITAMLNMLFGFDTTSFSGVQSIPAFERQFGTPTGDGGYGLSGSRASFMSSVAFSGKFFGTLVR